MILANKAREKRTGDEVAKVLPNLTRPQSSLSLQEALLFYQRESTQSRGSQGVTGKRKERNPNTDDRELVSLLTTETLASITR